MVTQQIGIEYGTVSLLLDVLEESLLTTNYPTVAHAEHDTDSVVSVTREPDGVYVPSTNELHRLWSLELVQPGSQGGPPSPSIQASG